MVQNGIVVEDIHTNPTRLGQYIEDLCLMDEVMSEFSFPVRSVTATVLASQWANVEVPVITVVVPIDTVHIALSKCVTMLTERRSTARVVDSFVEQYYRAGVVPKTFPSEWTTSKSYLCEILGQPVAPIPTTPIRQLRSSTLQHAADWLIESRRRSRSTRKRSRSATPHHSAKRQCITDRENTDPNKQELRTTPRRSLRLQKLNREIF